MNICMMSLMMDEYPVKRIVDTAVSCGMKAIDWIGLHGKSAAELKKLCVDAGLPVAAHTMLKWGFIQGRPDYLDEFKSSLEDACILGAKVLMLPPFARQNQSSLADDRKRYAGYFAEAYELSAKAGVTLTLESTGFGNSPITTADECLEILHQVPGLKITFDHGNTATADDPLAAFAKLREYVVHFHLKDWHIYDEPAPGGDLKRCGKYFADAAIGTGDLDIRSFWDTVTEKERELPVNLETKDYSGKTAPEDFFAALCSELQSW
ncbi:MAG: sugar phosphate isomerase/epimerase [Lentisphaeria bacterium]|nr:sugar phosphate isomerase/epimerase [Lentisphaerota bacterium]MBR2626179.1 sugar phosphate isomerase/epimerase [Lentisphaeria bacterium]